MNRRIDCIIPAAGRSSRMGKWKPMLPFRNGTIVEQCVRNALGGNCRILLVAGFRAEELQRAFQSGPDIRLVTNEFYDRGMVSSIFAGMRCVESDRFFVAHADMPLIPPSVYIELARKISRHILFPGFLGKTGHPVLIPSRLIPQILRHDGAPDLKSVLRKFPCETVPVQSGGIHTDIDTMPQYRRLLAECRE